MDSVLIAARLLLAAVLLTAAVGKFADRIGSQRALAGFGVPPRIAAPMSVLLPLAELVTAALLIFPSTAQWGGAAALLLMLAFTAGIANALRQGRAPDCHCFGQIHSEPASKWTLVRNLALAAIAGVVVAKGPGPSVSSWIADRTAAELVAIVGWIAAAVLGAYALRFWRHRKALRIGLSEARDELAMFPPGLPAGSLAPEFSLPSIHGSEVTLEQLRARGVPVALFFVSPDCGPCQEWFPDLARWQRTLADRVAIALISSGTAEQNLAAANDTAAEVLLEKDWAITKAYRVLATPTGVLVTADGRIAGIASSGTAIEPLIRLALRQQQNGASRAPQPSSTPVG